MNDFKFYLSYIKITLVLPIEKKDKINTKNY